MKVVRVCRQPVTRSATAESLRNTDLKRAKCILIQQRSSGIVTAVEMYVNESGVL
jgi:protein-tyrosine-phosphatase